MEIRVEEKEYCKLMVNYQADPEAVENKRSEVLMAFKNAPVPGNRKNKASLDSIRIYYYSQIENALKQAMMEQAFHDTVAQENVSAFGVPEFVDSDLKRNKFSCSFSFNIKPKFELAQYKGLEIPTPDVKFDVVEQAEKMMEELRVRYGESAPYKEDEFVQMKDVVILDVEAFDGETKIESSSAEGQILTVGQSGLPGLDEAILGMKIGETRNVILQIPKDSLPSLAGKEIKFVITLVMGSKVSPMPLNEELAKKAGKADLEELRNYVMNFASVKRQEVERSSRSEQIINRLLANHQIKVPNFLSLSEAKYLAANSNTDWEILPDQDKERFLEMAEKNVKLSMILDAIRSEEPEAQLSDQEVLSSLEGLLGKSKSKDEVEKMMAQMSKTGQLNVLAGRMRDEFTMDFLIKQSTFID